MPDIGDVSARLTLDTTQFDAGMKQATASVEPNLRAVEKAAKKAAEAQATAAKYSADAVTSAGSQMLAARNRQIESSKDLASIERAVKQGFLSEADGAQAATAALQRKTEAQRALNAAMSQGKQQQQELARLLNAGDDVGASASHVESAISNRMAASAAIRGLQGNQGIRSIEAFVSTIPGVSTALQSLFPIIGAAGLAGLFVDMGIKAYDAFQKAEHAAEATRQAFQEAHDKAQISIDDKEIENQKIQDQIDKITGRPNNGLALALLEDKKEADALIGSLDDVDKLLEGIFKEHGTSGLGRLLSAIQLGPQSTQQQEQDITGDNTKIKSSLDDAQAVLDTSTKSLPKGKAGQAALHAAKEVFNASVNKAFDEVIGGLKEQAGELGFEQTQPGIWGTLVPALNKTLGWALPVPGKGIDNSNKTAELSGSVQAFENARAHYLLDTSIADGNRTLGGLKQGEGAGKTADEAQRKSIEDQFSGLQFNALKEQRDITPAEDLNFWQDQLKKLLDPKGPKAYADNVRMVMEKAYEAQKKFTAQQVSGDHAITEAWDRAAKQKQEALETLQRIDDQYAKQEHKQADAAAKLAEVQEHNSELMREQALAQGVATGAVSRHDQAIQLAALHQAQYAAQLAELDRQAQADREDTSLSDEERQTRSDDRAVKQVTIQGDAQRSASQDNVAIYQTSAFGGAVTALQRFSAEATDASQVLAQLTTSTLNEFNKALLEEVTGNGKHNHIWKDAGKGVATDVAGASFKASEGYLLKAIGIGKGGQLGTRSNPMYTKAVDQIVAPATDAGTAGSIASAVTKSGGGGSIIGSVLSSFGIPGFANGGGIDAGTLSIIGENGPELFMPHTSGTIIPNHKAGSAFGGGGDIHFHPGSIDARGSNDPAAVEAAVQRGIKQAAPHLISASVQAGRADNMRRAPSQRK